MSDIIHIMPDTVANQIAAGEVIQRPASIVKELVENSIDAGATRIQVVVTDAGKTCIQVIDNGKGMSETDARVAFERHATSKIKEANDLFALTTMGFRGEALPSIAAVAQVELRTRQASDELGISITIEGSRITYQEAISCSVGANFSVKNIFYNIPARRKFLKSDKTELTNIITEFERIALAHPEIAFSLASPNCTILDLPSGTYRQRVVNIIGKSIDKKLLSLNSESPVVKISGFVGSPESSKKKGAQQFFFVNGRFMRHPYFAKAVLTAYDRLIPDGEQTPFFIMLEVDPSKIDVNIHPTKTEIKFEDEHTIWQILLASVRETLGRFNAIPTIDFNAENQLEIPSFNNQPTSVKTPEININPNFNPFESTGQNSCGSKQTRVSQSRIQTSTPPFSDYTFDDSITAGPDASISIPFNDYSPVEETHSAEEHDTIDWEPNYSALLLYRGQYILTPTDDGLYVIDAHRAHCRILYEGYLQLAHQNLENAQRLLFPQLLELNASQALVFDDMLESIEQLGFNLSPLGNNTYSVLAVPSNTEGLNALDLLHEIIDNAMQHTIDAREEWLKSAALSIARRAAIPVGQYLTNDEMADIVKRLIKTSTPNFTPDGKRIIIVITNDTITSQF